MNVVVILALLTYLPYDYYYHKEPIVQTLNSAR